MGAVAQQAKDARQQDRGADCLVHFLTLSFVSVSQRFASTAEQALHELLRKHLREALML
jgi:hypothetical protein